VVDLKFIEAVWYRRGYVHIEMNFDGELIAVRNDCLNKHLEGERETLQDYVMYRIQQRTVVEHKPNRTVPINLPVDIEEKIKCLMSRLRLDSGSIDII
jgi:hypothetical protein